MSIEKVDCTSAYTNPAKCGSLIPSKSKFADVRNQSLIKLLLENLYLLEFCSNLVPPKDTNSEFLNMAIVLDFLHCKASFQT